MKDRKKLSRIPTTEALRQLLSTEPNEAQFNATLDQLDDFISAQLAGEADEARFPGVAAYLDSDPRLAEIYDRFYRLEVDARSDNLKVPELLPKITVHSPPSVELVETDQNFDMSAQETKWSFPKPDLSFLLQPASQPENPVLAWLHKLIPNKSIIEGFLDPNMALPEVALRGGSGVSDYDNTPQQYIYYADSYCLFLNITPGIVAQTPAQIDGNLMNQTDPDENYTGTVYLIQDQVRLQEITLDEFGFFGLDGVEAGEYSLLLALEAHSIWIQGLVIA